MGTIALQCSFRNRHSRFRQENGVARLMPRIAQTSLSARRPRLFSTGIAARSRAIALEAHRYVRSLGVDGTRALWQARLSQSDQT
jgi:hypothetical protein